MKAEDLYRGRKPKSSRRHGDDQALRRASKQPGKYKASSPTVSRGSYDVKDRYLRGQAGGEAHPNYVRSSTKR